MRRPARRSARHAVCCAVDRAARVGSSPRVIALAAATAGAFTSVGSPAFAYQTDPDDCGAEVVDLTGDLDTLAVGEAIAELRTGPIPVEARVRVFDSVGDGALADEVGAFVAACLASGAAADTYLVLAVSVGDRRTEIRYGDRLEPALEARYDAIMDEAINPQLADGDLTGGVLAGLGAVASAVASSDDSVDTDDDRGVPDAAADDGSSPVGPAVGAVVVLVAGGSIGVGTLIARRRKLVADRQAFAFEIAEPLGRAGWLRERSARLMTQSELWERVLGGRSLDLLLERRRAVRDTLTAAEGASSLVGQATPRGVAEASGQELVRARQALGDLDQALASAAAAADALESLGEQLDRLRVTVPAKRGLLLAELDEALELAARQAAEGWTAAEPVAVLEAAKGRLEALDLSDFAPDLLTLSEAVEAAEADLFAARHDVQSLPDRPVSLTEWSQQLATAADAERVRADRARHRLAGVAVEHADDSWRWAIGHPDAAHQHLARADGIRRAAMGEPFEQQRFDEVGLRLEEAGLELLVADSVLDEVDVLLVDLTAAVDQAAGRLAEAREALAEAIEFSERNRSDLPQRRSLDPTASLSTLDGLAAELRVARPNYLRVAQTATREGARLDQFLTTLERTQAQASSLRRELAREIDRARRCVERARSALGWQLFGSEDSAEIDELAEALDALVADEPVYELLEPHLERAGVIADRAVEVENRIIARRRRNSTWVVIGTSGSWGSGSGSSGGGAGGSFGGFGGGGGGSFSGFGGGGGGGFGGFGGGGGGGSSW